MPALAESNLSASCSFVISRLKNMHFFLASMVIFVARLRAKEVLPIAGLAPIKMKSDLFKPVMYLSSIPKPDGMALNCSLSSPVSLCNLSYTSLTITSEIFLGPFTSRPCLMSYIFCSAESSSVFALASPPDAFSIIS